VLPAIGVCRFWGYDTQLDKLIAVQFTPSGVLTKSVTGWVGDTFVAQRVDNVGDRFANTTGRECHRVGDRK